MSCTQPGQKTERARNDILQTPRVDKGEEKSVINPNLPDSLDSGTISNRGSRSPWKAEALINPDTVPRRPSLQEAEVGERSPDESTDFQEEGEYTTASKSHYTLVSFDQDDPENPFNWSAARKIYILFAGIISVINSTLGSSLPSGAIEYLASYFHVANEQQLVLPISVYLIGYVLGPVIFGPLSETYGRKLIMVGSFIVFTIFTMACALAPNWPAFLIFRLVCGFMASSAITVVGGLYADVFADPVIRGRAMAAFMAVSKTCPPMGWLAIDKSSGDYCRPSIGSHHFRFCLRRHLALDLLGRPHICRIVARLPHLPSGNLRPHHSQSESETIA